MFALEIDFKDGLSAPELLYVRRPQAIVGASDFAHVVIDDMKQLDFQLRIVRGLGRQFRCQPVGEYDEHTSVARLLDGVYEGEAALDLGVVNLHVTVLDVDLLMKEKEPPDRAGVRVLRQSCAFEHPKFPAVVVMGTPSLVMSFMADQPLYLGRSKRCSLRVDAADVSAEHARLGYESGEFWVEDLGSTNGTFINQQPVSGRQNVPPGVPIVLGREITIAGISSEAQLTELTSYASGASTPTTHEVQYPALVSKSELVRPVRLELTPGSSFHIGRDPRSDVWIGAPHVSRKHGAVSVSKTGWVTVEDHSTNGIAHDQGMLRRGETLELEGQPKVLDFGGGVTIALCFDPEQEERYANSDGGRFAFVADGKAGVSGVADSVHSVDDAQLAADELPQGASLGIRLVHLFLSLGVAGKVITILVLLVIFVVSILVIDAIAPMVG